MVAGSRWKKFIARVPEYNLGLQQKDDFVLSEELLYTLHLPPGKTAYAQLVQPPSSHYHVIRRAYQEVGHQGMRKKIERFKKITNGQINVKMHGMFEEMCPVSGSQWSERTTTANFHAGSTIPMPNCWHGPHWTFCAI